MIMDMRRGGRPLVIANRTPACHLSGGQAPSGQERGGQPQRSQQDNRMRVSRVMPRGRPGIARIVTSPLSAAQPWR
jgi:hypothetical protein